MARRIVVHIVPGPATPEARQLARELGVTVTLGDVLHRRGYCAGERTQRFLDPKLAHLSSPHVMADRDLAIDRIASAVRRGERIAVFGDYDCDGITSVAILTEAIEFVGGQVTATLADRFSGGYGLTEGAVDQILSGSPKLLIACDCGTNDHDRVDRLSKAGVDVVVIDHHLVPEEKVAALAFINPNRPDCPFPYKHLASCGLALTLAAGLRTALASTLDVRQWLDLVAIGTVADVVPLDGDNRVLVRAGMRILQNAPRPGLHWIAELAKVSLRAGVTSETISFEIAPRINAPGRLASPRPALDLLLAKDHERARETAVIVEDMRTRRRQIQERILAEALAEIDACGYARDPAIVLGRPGWNIGVVGIVAAQLAERFTKPCVTVGFDTGVGRGSVRGPLGMPIYDLLCQCRAAPITFGGHQAAAGVQLQLQALDRFRDLFNQAVADHLRGKAGPSDAREKSDAEVRLDSDDRAVDVVTDMTRLEPCGLTNPAPPIAILGSKIVRSQAVRGGHLQVVLQRENGELLYGFGLGMGQRAAQIPASQRADVVGRLRRDTFRGGDSVGLRIARISTPES